MNGRANQIRDVGPHCGAISHGDRALESIHPGGRILQQVKEFARVDASRGGDCDRVGVGMVVVRVSMRRLVGRGVEEQFPKRELAQLVLRPRQVIQQRGIDSRADRPDDRGEQDCVRGPAARFARASVAGRPRAVDPVC